MRVIRILYCLAALCCGLALPKPALAAANDISLLGLGRPRSGDLSDPAVQRYRALGNELFFAMFPKPMQPAETLGVSGFEVGLTTSFSDINESADYWLGQGGLPVTERGLQGQGPPGMLVTPTLHLRKGLPWSMEIGILASYLAESEMFFLAGEYKIALYESYFKWVPSFAFRGSFGRLFGASDYDILGGEGDLMASLPIAIADFSQITPYLGVGVLFAHINSTILDETPYAVSDPAEQKGGLDGSLYTFPTIEWSDNAYARMFFGLRYKVASFAFMYEFDYAFNPGPDLTSHSLKVAFDL